MVFTVQQPSAKVSLRGIETRLSKGHCMIMSQNRKMAAIRDGNLDYAAKSHPPPRQRSTPIGPEFRGHKESNHEDCSSLALQISLDAMICMTYTDNEYSLLSIYNATK